MKVIFGGSLGYDEPVTHEGVGLVPSRNDAGRDPSHRSIHIVGRPHRVHVERGSRQDQIRSLAIKLAEIYQQVLAVPVDRDDPAAEIVRDFVVGFTAMHTSEMATVAQILSRPDTRSDVEDAIRDASWAGTRNTRLFYLTLAKSL